MQPDMLHFRDHHSLEARKQKFDHSLEARKQKFDHEQRIRAALDKRQIKYTHRFCVQLTDQHFQDDMYVDFLVHTKTGDLILLGVDQHQRMLYGVKRECERMRTMIDLLRRNGTVAPGSKITWIKYNPDCYSEGGKRYLPVDAWHGAEESLAHYVSMLQDGTIDNADKKERHDIDIVYIRYNKSNAKDLIPMVAMDDDFFHEFVPYARSFNLTEYAIQNPGDEGAIAEPQLIMDDDLHAPRHESGDETETDAEEHNREFHNAMVPCTSGEIIPNAHTDNISAEIISECIDAVTGENSAIMTRRWETIEDTSNWLVTIDNLPRCLGLTGASSLSYVRRYYKRFSKLHNIECYVLLHRDSTIKKGQRVTAFAPAHHVLAFLRARQSPAAQDLVARIDNEIAERLHEDDGGQFTLPDTDQIAEDDTDATLALDNQVNTTDVTSTERSASELSRIIFNVVIRSMGSIRPELAEQHRSTAGLVSIDLIASLHGICHLKLRQSYNKYADKNGFPHYPRPQKTHSDDDHKSIAFAPAHDVLRFLRARQSPRARDLIKCIDMVPSRISMSHNTHVKTMSCYAIITRSAGNLRIE